jgi:hypothetical protein
MHSMEAQSVLQVHHFKSNQDHAKGILERQWIQY